jgi:NAD+ synthase
MTASAAAPPAGPEWGHPGVRCAHPPDPRDQTTLDIDVDLARAWLVAFLRDEIPRRRGFERVVVGLSGGVDSSLTAALCVEALGPEAVHGFLLPYRHRDANDRDHGGRGWLP